MPIAVDLEGDAVGVGGHRGQGAIGKCPGSTRGDSPLHATAEA